MRISHWALLVGALAVAGCKGGGDRAGGSADTAGMMGHIDSGGMGMGKMDSGMMPQMRAHMDSMMRMSPQQMSQMMGTHERMMSMMMDQMGGEMRQMKMSADPKWTALTDSVRQDLAELPSLSGQKLQERMRAHEGRVRRLLEMHQGMMERS
jgi:hypothetical protein